MFRNLEQLTEHVYIFPRDESPNAIQPNIGLIQLEHETILIDAGNSPRHARQLMAAMMNKTMPPVQTIILTHHHWDHSFGTATFNPKQVIAHQETAKILGEYAKREWSANSLREEIIQNPKREMNINAMLDAINDWRDFRIAQVSLSFNQNLTLYYDNLSIELEFIGGRHASDSIVVKIPEERVMFVGDCFYPPVFHLREEGDEDLDIVMLEHFYSQDYAFYVDGHGKASAPDALAKVIAWEKGRQGIKE